MSSPEKKNNEPETKDETKKDKKEKAKEEDEFSPEDKALQEGAWKAPIPPFLPPSQ